MLGFGYSDTPYAKMLQKEQEETKKTIALLKNPKMGDRGALRVNIFTINYLDYESTWSTSSSRRTKSLSSQSTF